jgi:hypothetical protein
MSDIVERILRVMVSCDEQRRAIKADALAVENQNPTSLRDLCLVRLPGCKDFALRRGHRRAAPGAQALRRIPVILRLVARRATKSWTRRRANPSWNSTINPGFHAAFTALADVDCT